MYQASVRGVGIALMRGDSSRSALIILHSLVSLALCSGPRLRSVFVWIVFACETPIKRMDFEALAADMMDRDLREHFTLRSTATAALVGSIGLWSITPTSRKT
jgi:hypothetical protein